jgi:CRP/FNR family transcriptional regulator, cyclic AMP receptor protein
MSAPLAIPVPAAFVYLGPAQAYIDDIHLVLGNLPLLDSFDLAETTLLGHFMACFSAPRGTELVHQGDLGEYLVILLTGRADVHAADATGLMRRVATVGPGAVLGDMAMIDHRERKTTCVAADPVDMVVLTTQAYKDILLTAPRLGNKLLMVLLHAMSERLHALQIRCPRLDGPL